MTHHLIHLISGEPFDYSDPFAGTITVHDVAHALARINRYGGHHAAPDWSVAAHTLLVASIVGGRYKDKRSRFGALHHDDAEFVTGDWPTPLKDYIRDHGFDFAEIERPIEAAVGAALGYSIDELHTSAVKDADALAYEIEIRFLKPSGYASRADVDDETMEWALPLMRALVAMDAPEIEDLWLHCHTQLVTGAWA